MGHCLEDLLTAVEEDEPMNHNTKKLVNKVLEEKMIKEMRAKKLKRKRDKRI